MKRVCTLRKVYRSLSKVLLEKLFFIVLISWLFIATQFLLFLSYLQPGDFHVANISIFFETCKFLSIFFQKKAIFLMFFIKQPPFRASNQSIFPFSRHFAPTKPTPYYIQELHTIRRLGAKEQERDKKQSDIFRNFFAHFLDKTPDTMKPPPYFLKLFSLFSCWFQNKSVILRQHFKTEPYHFKTERL